MKIAIVWVLVCLMTLSVMPLSFTLAEEEGAGESANQGEIKGNLDGDYAYISDISVTDVQSGVAPFDAADEDPVDEEGNDSSAENDILRTFDTATYTIQYQTQIRQEQLDQNIGGYKSGRVYFQFLLPMPYSEAKFNLSQMTWLNSLQDIKYTYTRGYANRKYELTDGNGNEIELNEGDEYTMLSGSFILTSGEDGVAAIGASVNTLSASVLSLHMKNGQAIQPLFSIWLQYNVIVGVNGETIGPEQYYIKDYGRDENGDVYQLKATAWDNAEMCYVICADKWVTHPEAATLSPTTAAAKPLTISATTNYNVRLQGNFNSQYSTRVFTLSWNDTENTEAPFYGAGELEGRLMNYGILLEMRELSEGKGLRGLEVPENDDVFTFDFYINTNLYHEDIDEDGNITRTFVNNLNDYLPMYWGGRCKHLICKFGYWSDSSFCIWIL